MTYSERVKGFFFGDDPYSEPSTKGVAQQRCTVHRGGGAASSTLSPTPCTGHRGGGAASSKLSPIHPG